MTNVQSTALIKFYQCIDTARPPERADRSASGTAPTRAFRYCEPLRNASAFGWYVFSPIDFSLVWDGHDIAWSFAGANSWHDLSVAQFPHFSAKFDAAAPDFVRSHAPPFLAALPEPGLIQIWSGLFARTRPGYSLAVRPPVNMPRGNGYDVYEGVVETDQWFGPLFTNLRLARTGSPIRFGMESPLFQVQLLPRDLYGTESAAAFDIARNMAELTMDDWEAYRETVVRKTTTPSCPLGSDALRTRRRRVCEHAG